MKAMKGLSMNKMLGGIKRRQTSGANGAGPSADAGPQDDSPESVASRSVRLFCESGGRENAGDEVTFLPAIVDAAESSPAAAAECARLIRKYLHKDFWSKPSFQYNAIMLMRILADNPGMTFTRSIDKKFVDTAKELLRYGRDHSVRQMLMETLDAFEATKAYDEGLHPILEMWRKEKEKAYKAYGVPVNGGFPRGPAPSGPPPPNAHSQNYFARSHSSKRLPDPVELANRLEEARTSAKLLQQVVACTPPAEVLSNDLIKEFADRCLSASRSIQGYMTADNPGPDNDTMEALIDTNEQLQTALSQHQRAVLNARKHLGLGDPQAQTPTPPPQQQQQQPPRTETMATVGSTGSSSTQQQQQGDMGFRSFEPPAGPPPSRKAVGKQAESGPSRSASGTPRPDEDPFRDPVEERSRSAVGGGGGGAGASSSSAAGAAAGSDSPPRLAIESYHPGFSAGSSAAAPSQPQAADRGGGGGVGGKTRGRGMTRDSESDLYDDSDDERYRPMNGGGAKDGNQQSAYRY